MDSFYAFRRQLTLTGAQGMPENCRSDRLCSGSPSRAELSAGDEFEYSSPAGKYPAGASQYSVLSTVNELPLDPPYGGLYTPRMAHRFALLTAMLTLGLVACSWFTTAPAATPTSMPIEARPTVTSTPRPTLGATLTLSPTAAALPSLGCPPPPADVPIPEIEDVLNFGDALVQYLNAGGSIERLAEQADAVGVLGDIGVLQGFMQSDLNGDDIPEIAISLVNWMDSFQEGKIYVAMCESGEYRLSYASPDRDDFRTAQIDSVFDMTGDGLDDLVIRRRGCGAHTCSEWIEVVVWHEAQLQDRMEDVYFDLPSTGIEFIGPVSDGLYQIYMTGNGVASVGAGPYHRRAVTWEWDQNAHLFRPGELELLPSPWRIHFVHDGDQAFTNGEYMLALDAYERVIHDDTLQDWPSGELGPTLVEERPQELAAYARFHRILTRLKMDDFTSAEVHYQDLIDNHPSGEPGDGFARMSQIFWDEFAASKDFNSACEEALDFAGANPSRVLDPLDYGYSNLTYTPSGLCPTTAGTLFELDAIAAAFVGGASVGGGVGTVVGSLVGAFVMTSLTSGMNLMGIDISYQLIVRALVLVAAVIFDVQTRKRD